MKKLTPEEVEAYLTKVRFKVITDYPDSKHQAEDIISQQPKDPSDFDDFHRRYPGVYRELEWHEERTIDELMSLDFVMVLNDKKPGYYLIGDCIPVIDYKIDTKSKKFISYEVRSGSFVTPSEIYPASKKDLTLKTHKNGIK